MSTSQPFRSASLALSVAGYLAMLAAIGWGLARARQNALATLDNPQATAEWQAWQTAAAAEATGKGPVQRKPPASPEPPTLVLMRDYYGVCLTAAVVLASVLYAFGLLIVQAMLRSTPPPGRMEG